LEYLAVEEGDQGKEGNGKDAGEGRETMYPYAIKKKTAKKSGGETKSESSKTK
jgi:hypothetical protein